MIWVWMSEYPDKTVGAIGAFVNNIGHVPLYTRSEEVARGAFKELAVSHRKASGQRVWLRRYVAWEDEEELP